MLGKYQIAGWDARTPLPAEAARFVGTWTQIATENYEAYLTEVVGLNFVVRKIALRVKPKPTWSIDPERNELRCHVECFGAKPMEECFRADEEQCEVSDPNLAGQTWQLRNYWSEGCCITEKSCAAQNCGKPILVKRSVTPDGLLVVTQEWEPGKVFTQTLRKVLV